MKRIMLTLVLAIAAGVWNLNWASGSQITSLCDEWNVLKFTDPAYYNFYGIDTIMPYKSWSSQTRHYYLKGDTTINSTHYTKAFYENVYIGALRESEDASKIFGIPVNRMHEYLLYDWSAQEKDTLQNFWVGEGLPYYLDIKKVVVNTIVDYKNPREFMINVVGHLKNGSDDSTLYAYTYKIIEGVGVSYGAPIIHSFIEEGSQAILCAYKNGEQVYTSTQGNRLGCFFDSRMITELLKGNWKVYKEKLMTSRSTKENDVDDEFLYTFTDSTMQMICPTCYSTPKFYGIEPYRNISGNNVFVEIWIEDLFGAIQENDSVTPYTSIKIRNITRNEIEWSYWGRFGDDQWIEHYQYLKRYPEELSDTIPLFIKDGPGSSTVEPVDPNLIYATLSKDILSIYVLRDMEINMVLYKAPSANHAPAVKRAIKATTFTDSISTTLTESGTYTLELTNPAWDYTIVGTFEYQVPQAVENTPANTPSATKILKDGQLLFLYEGKMYNVQGQQVQ